LRVGGPSGNNAPTAVSGYAVDGVPEDVRLPSQPGLELRGPESSEELDPELLSLPDPPRRERSLTVAVLALAALLSLAMVFALRRDVAYALGSGTAVDLGDLHAATDGSLGPHENEYVKAQALLGAAGGIRYERPFVDDTFRTLPVAGRTDLWADVRVPAGEETGRWQPPTTLEGRLVRFGAAGPRHRGLAGAIERASNVTVPGNAWLVIDGEAPGKARWTILLAAMFLGCAAWNVIAIRRIVRRVR
jgi:hypothetical protein